MFGTIRKHQKWLWLAIIIPTIISFVWLFGPTSRMRDGGRGSANYGSINGERVTQDQFDKARREVELRYLFMTGDWPSEDKQSNFDPIRETYQWLLLIQQQEKLGIRINSEDVARAGRENIRLFERKGVTSPAMFVQQILLRRGLGVDDFERFCRHFLGLQEIVATVGSSGKLVTLPEAQGLYRRQYQELATEAVFFKASNYLASVSVTPDALSQFYTNRLANYRLPERVQVDYVEFRLSNYLAQAETSLGTTNLADLVDDNYRRLGTNVARLFPEAKTPEAAKAKIREELIRKEAQTLARKRARDFDSVLFEIKPVAPENLQTLARTNGLEVRLTAPFDRENGPKELEVGPDFAKAAFRLTADEPFSLPIAGEDGVYVLAVNKRLRSENPPFLQIRDQVTADYKLFQATMLAQQAGAAFAQTATNSLAQGKSFAVVCATAQVSPIDLPPFSLSTRSLPEVEDRITVNQLKQIAFGTPPGKASPFVPTRDGGMVLYVKARLPLDTAKMNSELPEFFNYLRRNRQEEVFQEWFRKAADRGLHDTPLGQPKPPPNMSGAKS